MNNPGSAHVEVAPSTADVEATALASLCAALASPPTRPAAPTGGPPVLLIAAGSFSPLTTAHVAMLAHARDYFTDAGTSVAAAVLSPASDGYLQSKEASAASATATHRVAMAAAATAGVPWLAVDGVEAAGGRRLPTADAVGGIMRRVGGLLAGRRQDQQTVVPVAVVGVDVFVDFVDATKWPPTNVERLLRTATVAVYPRPQLAGPPPRGGVPAAADATPAASHPTKDDERMARLLRHPLLAPHAARVVWMSTAPPLDGSSSAVRAALGSGAPPPAGLLHPEVAAYITVHRLYGV
ncbi:hypothetical protein MMPV_002716 [Pyropia vietnamensis]